MFIDSPSYNISSALCGILGLGACKKVRRPTLQMSTEETADWCASWEVLQSHSARCRRCLVLEKAPHSSTESLFFVVVGVLPFDFPGAPSPVCRLCSEFLLKESNCQSFCSLTVVCCVCVCLHSFLSACVHACVPPCLRAWVCRCVFVAMKPFFQSKPTWNRCLTSDRHMIFCKIPSFKFRTPDRILIFAQQPRCRQQKLHMWRLQFLGRLI